jgi:hypothetical protein
MPCFFINSSLPVKSIIPCKTRTEKRKSSVLLLLPRVIYNFFSALFMVVEMWYNYKQILLIMHSQKKSGWTTITKDLQVNKPDDEGTDKNETNYGGIFLPIDTALIISFGVVFDHLAMGISLGVALGLLIDGITRAKQKK